MPDRFQSSIEVNCPVNECFSRWSRFEDLPSFMKHVREVRNVGGDRYHWVVDGPLGKKVEWDAAIDGFVENQVISWHSIGDPEVGVQGAVRFDEIGPNKTKVTSTIQYEPPAGAVGSFIADIFSNPQQMVEEDLRNFKELCESRTAGMRGSQAGIDAGVDQPMGDTQNEAMSKSRASGTSRDSEVIATEGTGQRYEFPGAGQPGYGSNVPQDSTVENYTTPRGQFETDVSEDIVEGARAEYTEREAYTRAPASDDNDVNTTGL